MSSALSVASAQAAQSAQVSQRAGAHAGAHAGAAAPAPAAKYALPQGLQTPAANAQARPAAAPARAGVKILVVDDMHSNLVAMQALLAQPGQEVLTASSGAAALELLLAHDVALALLDVQMPGMDGYALAELMRGSERTRGVPIIFLTAGAQEARATFRGYEAGAVDFLYKPVDDRVLLGKVQVFVELHRQRRAIAEHADELARLARANAMMLASVSHDLNEPLTVLAMNAEILLQRSESPVLRQAAARQKAATAVLRRHVDHLVSLAKVPATELKVRPQECDLAQLARTRWQLGADHSAPASPPEFGSRGDTTGLWDTQLLVRALDLLMLHAETHCGETPISVLVDGDSRSAVVLRVAFAQALPPGTASHLFGSATPLAELPLPLGAGLREPERIARAHGGSLIGGSSASRGTWFELMLPRCRGAAPQG